MGNTHEKEEDKEDDKDINKEVDKKEEHKKIGFIGEEVNKQELLFNIVGDVN